MPFTPPPHYEQAPSLVEGITVWKPLPETTRLTADAPKTFCCPQCGATTKYDVAAGGVACEHCGYTAQPQAARVGRRAEEFEFTLETIHQAQQGWGVERRELHCQSCGASLTLPENAITATCPFCASNQVNVHVAAADQLRPRFLIPFKVQAEVLRDRARQWLGQGWFHPGELASSAVVDHFVGIYLPYWTFDANIGAHWRAEVGYEHRERYYDAGSKSWRTRVKIRWRWEDGAVGLRVDDLLVVGSSRLSRLILDRLQPFNLNALVEYTPDYLAGWNAQAYDVSLTAAWECGKDLMREQAKGACYADIPSHHVRNFSMTADFADETWRYVLLPVYVAAYKFEDKVYQVMANGQSGVVAGQKPVAWWKVWLAIALLLAPGVGLGLLGLPLLLAGGVGLLPLALGALLLGGGGVFAYKIYRQAVDSEAA